MTSCLPQVYLIAKLPLGGELLSVVHKPYIKVQCIGVPQVYLITELLLGGELLDAVHKPYVEGTAPACRRCT